MYVNCQTMLLPFTIPPPEFDSPLVDHIVVLEQWKGRTLAGTTHPAIFFEIKAVFHLMESLGSARIEGNRTTIDDLINASMQGNSDSSEPLREISNIEDAMSWVESEFATDTNRRIDDFFIKELHRLTVKNLRPPDEGGQGDAKPGLFRAGGVSIRGSLHTPPAAPELAAYMEEFVHVINEPIAPRNELMRIALAHHRFAAIHPFRNGNGRVVRLLTYAMLIRSGLHVADGRILNPTAVFCHDRWAYINALSAADAGTPAALLAWCTFVLLGFNREFTNISSLLDVATLGPRILSPSITLAHSRGLISLSEHRDINSLAHSQVFSSLEVRALYPQRSSAGISQVIARYKKRGLIVPTPHANSRTYAIHYSGPVLLRPLIEILRGQGYIPTTMDY